MWSPVSSSRSSEDWTVPGAINMELSTWSTCFLFSFFLLLIDSPITFSSKEFAKFPEFPNSWDLRTRQPNTSQRFVLRGPVRNAPHSASPEVREARGSPPAPPLPGSPPSTACREDKPPALRLPGQSAKATDCQNGMAFRVTKIRFRILAELVGSPY